MARLAATALAMVLLATGAVVWLGAGATSAVVGAGSGRCLDVAGGTAASGAAVQLYDCNGQAGQQWNTTSAGELRVFNDSMCLDAYQKGTTAGTRVVIYACNGGSNQKWSLSGSTTPGCSGTSPITCHYAVAPGNYTVEATLGSDSAAGQTEMWVESRRLMLPATSTAAGAHATYSFTVNVRQPEGQPTGQGGTGNPGLDIRFSGSRPQVSAVSVTPATQPLVAYLAGDSTTCDQSYFPYAGWGQMLTSSVGPGAAVANYADSGESSGSFLRNSVLFPALLSKVKAGDPVYIQFGHNNKTTSASAFRSNLTSLITQTRAKGGVPVLVTPPARRQFSGSQLTSTALHVNGVGVNLPAEMRALGTAQRVPVIDLTAKSEALVESLGPTASAELFLRSSVDGVTDNTHFSEYGAGKFAGLVVESIRQQNLPLAGYLR